MWPFRRRTPPKTDKKEARPRYEARPGTRPVLPAASKKQTKRARKPATVSQTLWMTTALLVVLALMFAGVGYFGFSEPVRDGGMIASELTFQFALVAMVVVVFAALGGILLRHFRGLRQLDRAMLMLANRDADWTPPRGHLEGQGAVSALFRGLSRLQDSWRGRSSISSGRLTAILGALSEGVVVITAQGQVTLVNAGARALFGAGRLLVGSSAFDAFDPDALRDALDHAAEAGRPVRAEIRTATGQLMEVRIADLGEELGVLLSFANIPEVTATGVEESLHINDVPPEALPPDPETPLRELPGLVLNVEATGLNVRDDRIVAVAAVRTFGDRVFPAATFDELVNPGILIPPRATASHGIDDAMVAEAMPYQKVFERLQPMAHATVLVGFNLAFDRAMLRRENRVARIKWEEPYALCTMMLVAALEPERKDFSLERIAGDFGVDIAGRKTALGHAMVTAELFIKLIPRLAEKGVTTLGDAVALARKPQHLIQKQKAAGWE